VLYLFRKRLMEKIDLKANLRKETGKGPSRRYRKKGLIPAVFYGPEIGSIPLVVNQTEFKKAIKGKWGENVLVNLTLEEKQESEPQIALIRDIQIDPVKQKIIHIDFQKIALEKKIEISVPIELFGKAEGVKAGGVLQQIERELEIKCMPLQIPERIEVDVTNLGIGESIHVKDISLGKDVEILSSGEKTIVTILSPKVEEEKAEEEAVEEAAPSSEQQEKTKEPETT